MNGILCAAQIPDQEEIQLQALQALDETPYIGYAHLGAYLQKIGEITGTLVHANSSHRVTIEALKFWQSLCRKEITKMQAGEQILYIPTCGPSLIGIALNGLLSSDVTADDHELTETNDDEEWTVCQASSVLLGQLVEILKDQAWAPVNEYFMQRI